MTFTAIAWLVPRRRATVAGEVRSVKSWEHPSPRTEVELDDGSGVVLLRYLGRRYVPGLTPGRRLVAQGTPGLTRGTLVMLNPLYCFERAG